MVSQLAQRRARSESFPALPRLLLPLPFLGADVACLGCNKSQQKFETERRSWRPRLSSLPLPSSVVRRVDGVPRERVQSTEEGDANEYMW